jgi:sortase A
MSRVHRTAFYLSRVLVVVGIFALGYSAAIVIDARMYQARELKRFERDRQAAVAAAAVLALAPSPPAPPAPVVLPPPAEGTSIAQIQIERLHVSVVVVQGESEAVLERAVGHLARTALPGVEGNVVLAGHRDTFFRPLKDIREGDVITLKTRERDFDYVVESLSIVKPTDVQVLRPTGGHTLTLITCFPFYYVGSAPSRFIVVAREVGAV